MAYNKKNKKNGNKTNKTSNSGSPGTGFTITKACLNQFKINSNTEIMSKKLKESMKTVCQV